MFANKTLNQLSLRLTVAMCLGITHCGPAMDNPEDDFQGESVGQIANALTTTSYDGHYAAVYASSYYTDAARNTRFPDYTALGGDCTNFANQALLAGFAKTFLKDDVYSARTRFQDRENPYNAWYYSSPTDLAQPQWKGAEGLYTYLKIQAEHPSYNGIKVQQIAKDTTKSAAAAVLKLGDLVSLREYDPALAKYVSYHSMIVSTQSSDPNYHQVSYRSGICRTPCPPATKYVKDVNATTWSVFRITGFTSK